jgi:hypothetical protein
MLHCFSQRRIHAGLPAAACGLESRQNVLIHPQLDGRLGGGGHAAHRAAARLLAHGRLTLFFCDNVLTNPPSSIFKELVG